MLWNHVVGVLVTNGFLISCMLFITTSAVSRDQGSPLLPLRTKHLMILCLYLTQIIIPCTLKTLTNLVFQVIQLGL